MPITHAVFSFDQRNLFHFAVSSSKHRPKENFTLVYLDSGNDQKIWEKYVCKNVSEKAARCYLLGKMKKWQSRLTVILIVLYVALTRLDIPIGSSG